MIFCWKSAPKSVKMFQKSENKRIKDKSNSRTGHKAALIFYILFSKVFIVCQLSGNAMFPSLKDGDLVLGFRLEQEIQKDDLILYEMDGEICASRVAAKGTDYVDMDEEGRLYINGTVQSGEILYPTEPRELLTYPYQVPEGHIFVLGDYRTQASDS